MNAVTVADVARMLADIRIDPVDLPHVPLCSGPEDTAYRAEYGSHPCRVCREPNAEQPVILPFTDVGERWLDLCEGCRAIVQRLLRLESPTRLLAGIRAEPSTLPAAPPDADGEDITLRVEYEDHHFCRGCGRTGAPCPVILRFPEAGNRWLDLCDACRPLIQQALDAAATSPDEYGTKTRRSPLAPRTGR